MYELRAYQEKLNEDVYASWAAGNQNTIEVLPTGGGKTKGFAKLVSRFDGTLAPDFSLRAPAASCAIVHRNELVNQISLAYAQTGVRHKIIGQQKTIKQIVEVHVEETGNSYYDPNAEVAIAGVDTLVNHPQTDPWLKRVKLWVGDEAHHFLAENKWGRTSRFFPNARGLGVTATPLRADGKGLGRHADGVFDSMVLGPSMRDLIGLGYLCDYRIICPPSDLVLDDVPISKSGEFNKVKLEVAHKRSRIVGDVVSTYLAHANGLLGVTFAINVEEAGKIAARFRSAGVAAEVIHAGTPIGLRNALMRKFRAGHIRMLVNVDLFGEGFDLPAMEVAIMARATASFGLYCQQFGRVLRILEGKKYGLVIDHVGNVLRHAEARGLPDSPQNWTLDRREKKASSSDNSLKLRVCPECMAPFERIYRECPNCGHYPEPAGRSLPEQVDGDLYELSPDTLARLRGEVFDPHSTPSIPYGATAATRGGIRNRHTEKVESQEFLREAIAWWAGQHRAKGRPDSEIHRRFYLKYGVDVLSAQALPRVQADKLSALIQADLFIDGVVITR